MKASELINKLQIAIEKVGDSDVKGVVYDDFFGGVNLSNFNCVNITDKNNIVISESSIASDCFLKFEEIK